jgi:hypothetical protein
MSVPRTGLITRFGMKLETTYGTKAEPCSDQLDLISGDVKGEREILGLLTQHGKREMLRTIGGKYAVSGTPKFPIQLQGLLGLMLNSLMGEVSTTDNGDGSYTHVFTVRTTPYSDTTYLPSYTIYRDKGIGIFEYAGCLVQDLTINSTPTATGEIDVNIFGRSDELVSAQAELTYPSAQPCAWYNVSISVNSSDYLRAEKLTLKLANDYEQKYTHDGTAFINYAVPKQFTTDIDFDAPFESLEMVKRLWGSVSATSPQFTVLANTMTIDITSPTEIGTSGRYFQMSIDIPEAILFGDMPEVAGANDIIMQPLKFKARLDQGAGYGVQITLVNDTASYAV